MNPAMETESIWSVGGRPPRLPTLTKDVEVDVAIVGAGITGLTAAALLKRAGKTVAVLDRDAFGSHGTTHRTSAHLTAALDESYPTLMRNFDVTIARAAVQASTAAIELIERLAHDLKFINQFRRVDGYRYTESAAGVDDIEADCQAARQLGLHAELVDAIPLPFTIKRGFRLPHQAQFHPLKHLFGLAKFVVGDGSQVFHQSAVRGLEQGKRSTLMADRGTVTASSVILATHTPMGIWPTLQTRLVPYHSYCLAVRVAGPVPLGLFWDTENPYHYIRQCALKDETLLIIGGADAKTGQVPDTRKNFAELERYARRRFRVRSIAYRWSDQFFESADGLPYIGRAPGTGSARVYLGTGYSGTGLTYGTAAAMLISDLILGRKNPCQDAFDPNRVKPLASARRVLEAMASTAQGLLTDRLFTTPSKRIVSIKRGEGKIVAINGERLGVYRDKKGTLKAVSAVCTHLGCLLDWNTAEKHWDCKCHGSLFTPDGEPFAGPATKVLATKVLKDGKTPARNAAAKSR